MKPTSLIYTKKLLSLFIILQESLNDKYPYADISEKNTKITDINDSIKIKFNDNEVSIPKPSQPAYDSMLHTIVGATIVLATLFLANTKKEES